MMLLTAHDTRSEVELPRAQAPMRFGQRVHRPHSSQLYSGNCSACHVRHIALWLVLYTDANVAIMLFSVDKL